MLGAVFIAPMLDRLEGALNSNPRCDTLIMLQLVGFEPKSDPRAK